MSKRETVNVPCNGCKLCCRGDLIFLKPSFGDVIEDYEHEPAPEHTFGFARQMGLDNAMVLKHKKNGDCIYLTEDGCSIHGRAPHVCRTFDCRMLIRKLSSSQLDKLVADGAITREVVERGRELFLGK